MGLPRPHQPGQQRAADRFAAPLFLALIAVLGFIAWAASAHAAVSGDRPHTPQTSGISQR